MSGVSLNASLSFFGAAKVFGTERVEGLESAAVAVPCEAFMMNTRCPEHS